MGALVITIDDKFVQKVAKSKIKEKIKYTKFYYFYKTVHN